MNIEINGVTLQAEFMDADFMLAYEMASKDLATEANENKRKQWDTAAAGFLAYCECVDRYFDAVFGEGTADQLFGGNHNFKERMLAVEAIQKAADAAKKEFNDLTNKYTQRQKQNGFNSMQGHNKKQHYNNNQRRDQT